MIDEGIKDNMNGVKMNGNGNITKTIEMMMIVLSNKTDKILIAEKELMRCFVLVECLSQL